MNFIEKCIENKNYITKIDDYIDRWHESNTLFEIYEYLGMTKEEYGFYLKESDYLKKLIEEKEYQKMIKDNKKWHSNVLNGVAIMVFLLI